MSEPLPREIIGLNKTLAFFHSNLAHALEPKKVKQQDLVSIVKEGDCASRTTPTPQTKSHEESGNTLGVCDKRQYEHCGPHQEVIEIGQTLPPFPCENWRGNTLSGGSESGTTLAREGTTNGVMTVPAQKTMDADVSAVRGVIPASMLPRDILSTPRAVPGSGAESVAARVDTPSPKREEDPPLPYHEESNTYLCDCGCNDFAGEITLIEGKYYCVNCVEGKVAEVLHEIESKPAELKEQGWQIDLTDPVTLALYDALLFQSNKAKALLPVFERD